MYVICSRSTMNTTDHLISSQALAPAATTEHLLELAVRDGFEVNNGRAFRLGIDMSYVLYT